MQKGWEGGTTNAELQHVERAMGSGVQEALKRVGEWSLQEWEQKIEYVVSNEHDGRFGENDYCFLHDALKQMDPKSSSYRSAMQAIITLVDEQCKIEDVHDIKKWRRLLNLWDGLPDTSALHVLTQHLISVLPSNPEKRVWFLCALTGTGAKVQKILIVTDTHARDAHPCVWLQALFHAEYLAELQTAATSLMKNSSIDVEHLAKWYFPLWRTEQPDWLAQAVEEWGEVVDDDMRRLMNERLHQDYSPPKDRT